MRALLYILSALAVLTALPLARRCREYRPVTAMLSLQLVADVLQVLVQRYALDWAPTPYTGARRVLFELQRAAGFSWPASVAVVALLVLAGSRRLAAAAVGVYLVVLAALAINYPEMHGVYLVRTYFAIDLAVCAAGLVAFAVARARRTQLEAQHAVVFAAVAAETWACCAVYIVNPFVPLEWWWARAGYVLFFTVAIVVQMEALWMSRCGSTN